MKAEILKLKRVYELDAIVRFPFIILKKIRLRKSHSLQQTVASLFRNQ